MKNFKPMICSEIRKEVAKTKTIRGSLVSQVITHAVGELINYNGSLVLNSLMAKSAASKIYEAYPSMGDKASIYNKILRRLKHLRVNQNPQPKSFGQNDLLFDEFFKIDSYKMRRDAILKNNRKTKLEYFNEKFSVFSRDDYVISKPKFNKVGYKVELQYAVQSR